MKATEKLHNLGQSLWLDNITRDLLTSGTLKRYIAELSVTGLTSNPTIFDQALKNSHAYDEAIRQKVKAGKTGEARFFNLALEDLTQAADLFRPIHDRTNGVDGWVSLEVSPVRPCRDRQRCPGRPTPGRRGKIIRQVLERPHEAHRIQERNGYSKMIESNPMRLTAS